MTERSHLSIGEVLNLLQDEFPDITISKIRFLESQGLLDPERTPSGYRKFYAEDIERLRWILTQQKDNFLPLKVIKDRLASGHLDEPTPGERESAPATTATRATTSARPSPEVAIEPLVVAPTTSSAPVDVAVVAETDSAAPPRRSAARSGSRSGRRPARARVEPTGTEPLFEPDLTGVSLTRDEVLTASGLTARDLGELERFGLIASHSLGNTTYYGDDALLVAQLAAGFMGHGVEARHLRMYKVAAEREAGVFEQLVMPLLKQRNPASRQQATERLDELAGLGGRLRAAMLRQALQENLGGP